MKLEQLKPGQTVYSIRKHLAGNTTVRTISVYKVLIISVNVADRYVIASWNGNREEKYREHAIKSWRLKEPTVITTGFFGIQRLATREELKALKEKKNELLQS